MDPHVEPPPEDTPLGAFVGRLTRQVIAAAGEARGAVKRLWARPLEERVAAGRAIAGLRVVRADPSGVIELACSRNESRFREGDLLFLSRGDPEAEPRFLVTLDLDDETELIVSSDDPRAALDPALAEPALWVLDEGLLDMSSLLLDAVAEAADTAAGRERVLPLLAGTTSPRVDGARFDRAYARAEAWGLNESQAEALALAYAADLAHLIQGPPGTGKTLLLARLAQLLVEDGERVLITAFTHRAINNALNTLASLELRHDATPVSAVKIGRPGRADDLRVENFQHFDESPLAELSGGYVVGATPFATRTSRLSGVEFDSVIFDEASQITLPLAVLGMLPAKRAIFVGDHRQLPPVVATRHEGEILGESVFAALVDRGFDTMLAETYRMSAALTAWPSAQFYGGELRPAEAVRERRIVYPRPPARLAAILDPQEPQVFVDLKHRNATTRSRAEASLAVDLIVALLECGLAPEAIGVVVPFRAQAREIRSLLRTAMPERAARRRIVIDTVERMQGQERDLVIVSLTSSHPMFVAERADFLLQAERLNVAITRPRSKLIILGSGQLLKARPAGEEEQALVALLASLVAHGARRFIIPPPNVLQ